MSINHILADSCCSVRLVLVNDDREMINKLIDRNIDLNNELILIGEAALKKEEESKAIKGNVRLISYKANKVILESNG